VDFRRNIRRTRPLSGAQRSGETKKHNLAHYDLLGAIDLAHAAFT
jgi:hypothetical protein